IITDERDLFKVLGTYDINEERSLRAAEKNINTYRSYENLLANNNIEAVLIATPNDSHKDLSIKALQAGKHVVCEKPVTMNTQEFDEIIEVAQEEDKVFMVHQNRRWDQVFLLVIDLYKNHAIVDIFQIYLCVNGAKV